MLMQLGITPDEARHAVCRQHGPQADSAHLLTQHQLPSFLQQVGQLLPGFLPSFQQPCQRSTLLVGSNFEAPRGGPETT